MQAQFIFAVNLSDAGDEGKTNGPENKSASG
jgi:hypothetical protein